MSRALLIIRDDKDRALARHWLTKAKTGSRVEFKGPRRTLPQNDHYWGILTKLSTALCWHGRRLTPRQWGTLFLDALSRESLPMPNLDGSSLVDLNRTSSADLSVEEMADVITIIEAFATEHGVTLGEIA